MALLARIIYSSLASNPSHFHYAPSTLPIFSSSLCFTLVFLSCVAPSYLSSSAHSVSIFLYSIAARSVVPLSLSPPLFSSHFSAPPSPLLHFTRSSFPLHPFCSLSLVLSLSSSPLSFLLSPLVPPFYPFLVSLSFLLLFLSAFLLPFSPFFLASPFSTSSLLPSTPPTPSSSYHRALGVGFLDWTAVRLDW